MTCELDPPPDSTVSFVAPGLQLLEHTARTDPATGLTLYRVQTTRARWDGLIPEGEIGGWLTTVDNLRNDAWVDDLSEVVGHEARVSGSALVCEYSRVSDSVLISGDSSARRSVLSGDVRLSGSSAVRDSALTGSVQLADTASVMRSALGGHVIVRDNAEVCDCALDGDEVVDGVTRLTGSAALLD